MGQKDARLRDRIRCLVFVHQQWELYFRDPWALTARSGPVRQSGVAWRAKVLAMAGRTCPEWYGWKRGLRCRARRERSADGFRETIKTPGREESRLEAR